jgi:hypothetical protein
MTLDEKIRAWRFARQGIGALKGDSAAEILGETGWMRSVGGCSPYLGLFARGRLSREAVDAALAKAEIHELPAVRGCTYVVGKTDYAVALRAGQGHGGEIALAKKHLGVTDKELNKLTTKVLAALDKAPADPKDLKDQLGDAVRHLGEAGKKRGMQTTLPLVLGSLQSAGEIRRIPVDGRLDQQRYRYARWKPNPVGKTKLDDTQLAVELARRFFRWAGPSTAQQFAGWSGLGVRAAKAAIGELGLATVEDRFAFADDRDAVLAAKPTSDAALIGSIDNLVHLEGGEDTGSHLIVEAGTIVGRWDFDPDAAKIVWRTDKKASKAVEKAVDETEAFVRDQLGDARTFSLDSPESRKPRLAALKKR